MSADSQTPHFMTATQASKNQSSPLQPQASASPALSISVGKTRSLISSASKRIGHLGRKNRGSTSRTSLGLRISSPFSFQKLKDPEDDSHGQEQARRTGNPPTTQALNDKLCQSPLDKPLPRIPIDGESSESPINGLSLIDATERPLFRSLSPFETSDWPAISPEKQETTATDMLSPRPQQVSLDESVIERVRKLDLNDVEESTARRQGKRDASTVIGADPVSRKTMSGNDKLQSGDADGSKVMQAGDSKDQRATPGTASPRMHHVTKARSGIPQLKDPKTANLRKRLSSTALTGTDCKKPRVATEHPGESAAQSREHENTPKHHKSHRSQSRHRVTAQGSPYIVPRSKSTTCEDSTSNRDQAKHECQDGTDSMVTNNLTDDSADFRGTESTSSLSRSSVVREILSAIDGHCKSSIPVPKRRSSRWASPDLNILDVSTNKITESIITSEISPANDADIDTDTESRRGRRTGRTPGSVTRSTRSIARSTSKKLKDGDDTAVENDENTNGPSCLSSNDPAITTTICEEDGEKFRVKPLSRHAPKFGPTLRVSESANEFLLGNADSEASTLRLDPPSKRSSHAPFSTVGEPIEELQRLDHSQQTALAADVGSEAQVPSSKVDSDAGEIEGRHASAAASRVDVASAGESQSTIIEPYLQLPATSAPAITSDLPANNLSDINWPFDEDIVKPFEDKLEIVEAAEGAVGNVRHTEAAERQSIHATRPRHDQHDTVRQHTPRSTPKSQPSKVKRKDRDYPHHLGPGYPPRAAVQKVRQEQIRTVSIPGERVHRFASHEPPPVPRTLSPDMRVTPLFNSVRSTFQSGSQSKSRHHQRDQNTASPATDSNHLSAGKNVINNLKSLFHKRGEAGEECSGNRKASARPSPSDLKPLYLESPLHGRHTLEPRSPRVRNTNPTLLERRQTRQNELDRPFLKHRNVMTVSTTYPTVKYSTSPPKRSLDADVASSTAYATADEQSDAAEDSRPTDTNSSREPGELVSATNMVYNILNRAQDEPHTARKLDLIELSKLMVQILHTARDAEKAKEEARQYAAKAELECLKTRKEILEITTLIGKILSISQEG